MFRVDLNATFPQFPSNDSVGGERKKPSLNCVCAGSRTVIRCVRMAFVIIYSELTIEVIRDHKTMSGKHHRLLALLQVSPSLQKLVVWRRMISNHLIFDFVYFDDFDFVVVVLVVAFALVVTVPVPSFVGDIAVALQ